jgi:hypothetical protein
MQVRHSHEDVSVSDDYPFRTGEFVRILSERVNKMYEAEETLHCRAFWALPERTIE